MSMDCRHQQEISLLRRELKNVRDQIRGLRAQFQKEVSYLAQKTVARVEKTPEGATLKVAPIGFASTWHKTKNGTPRQGSVAEMASGWLDISAVKSNHPGMENPHYALENLEEFSHIWVLFYFHQNNQDAFVKTKIAPPRLKGKKVGLFSTRSPHRPNPIGLTLAKVIKVEDCKVFLQGLDLVDGTPILDIKPYIPHYDRPFGEYAVSKGVAEEAVNLPSWIEDSDSTLKVSFTSRALTDLEHAPLGSLRSKEDIKKAIVGVLQEDPRSNYRREKCSDRLYFFCVDQVHVTCWFDEQFAEVLKIKPKI